MMHEETSDPLASLRVLTMQQVCKFTSFTRQHIGRLVRAGEFPKPRRMGANRIVFLEQEYIDWFKSRPIVEPPDDPDDTSEI